MKEVYKYKLEGTTDKAVITKTNDKYNPYKVNVKISFVDYENARAFLEMIGFNTAFKKVI